MGPTRGARVGDGVRLVLRAVGRTLVSAGVLLLLFVAYQIWGTNLQEARSQRALRDDFRAVLGQAAAAPAETRKATPPPPTPEGDAVAIIQIPKIGLEKTVVEGVTVADLKRAPGHYPDTPLPGQPGNAAIAGHRTTYGAPFEKLDGLAPGDPIYVTTRQGRFRYDVESTTIVKPTQVEVLHPTEDNRLTLTTCHPKFSARQRLIVVAKLVDEPAIARTPGQVEGATPVSFEANLSGEESARGPTVLWGSIAAGVLLVAWILGRLWKRWPVYLLATPVFLGVLYVFFENVSRLLPANI